MSSRVCVGLIVGVQGVRGAVRIKSFTEVATDLGRYSPVEDESGTRRWRLKVTGEVKGVVIATLEGLADRTAAEALKGVRLYIERSRLPAPGEDEFLYADLIGLTAETGDGQRLGQVTGVADHGAGDVLEIALAEGGTLLLTFTRASVPEVDLAGGRLVVVPPVYAPDGPGMSEATGERDA